MGSELKKKYNSLINFKLESDGKVDKILGVSSAAKKAAMDETPSSDAVSLDETERSIISYCEGEVHAANDIVYDQFSSFKQLVTQATRTIANIKSLKYIHELFKSDNEYDIRKNTEEFKLVQNEFNYAKKDLHNFKSENKIIRQERSSSKPLLNWAIVLLIIFAESILNASFFAKGSDLGLLGGIIQAFVIVMINVLVANLVVLLIRRRFVVTINAIQKIGYTVLIGSLVTALVNFHFLVGHYRDALRIDFENAYAFSVLNYSASPFRLIDFESYILVLMGFLFFIVLVIDLYKLKDPYPGYGEVSKRFNDTKEEYDSLKFALLDDEGDMSKDINEKIELIKVEANSTYAEIQGIQITMQKLENKYNEHLNSIKKLAIATVKNYRSINGDMRTTPKPAYFNDDVEFEPFVVEFDYSEIKEKTASLEDAMYKIAKYEREAKLNIEKTLNELKEDIK
jgi:hypothetical protein